MIWLCCQLSGRYSSISYSFSKASLWVTLPVGKLYPEISNSGNSSSADFLHTQHLNSCFWNNPFLLGWVIITVMLLNMFHSRRLGWMLSVLITLTQKSTYPPSLRNMGHFHGLQRQCHTRLFFWLFNVRVKDTSYIVQSWDESQLFLFLRLSIIGGGKQHKEREGQREGQRKRERERGRLPAEHGAWPWA